VGTVEVFFLPDHPRAEEGYAWSYKAVNGETRYVAILGIPPLKHASRCGPGLHHRSSEEANKMTSILWAVTSLIISFAFIVLIHPMAHKRD
jgi:hypothetical protein